MTHAAYSGNFPHQILISEARAMPGIHPILQTLANKLLQIVHLRANLEIHGTVSEGIVGELLVCNEK